MDDFPKEKTATGDENLGLVGPDSFFFGTVPHYHGDLVRQLLLSAGALIIIAVPMVSQLSLFTTPFELIGAVILIICAGMTSPLRIFPLVCDVVVSGVGLVLYEPLAISAYRSGDLVLFVVYEALALIFLFAFYFSIKTVRGMFAKRSHSRRAHAPRIRADGEEYLEPPVSSLSFERDASGSERLDSRPGDMKEHGRYDD